MDSHDKQAQHQQQQPAMGPVSNVIGYLTMLHVVAVGLVNVFLAHTIVCCSLISEDLKRPL